MAKRRRNMLSLLDLSQETSKVALLEEKLQAICRKIHQLQCKDMLKKKVTQFMYNGYLTLTEVYFHV